MKPCARLIVNSGIKEVVVDKKWNSGSSQKRLEHNRRTIQLFNEAGVNLRYHDTNYVKFVKMNDSIISPLE
jgi:deoxycytidylate deaminase